MGITLVVLVVMFLISFVADQVDGSLAGGRRERMEKRCEISAKSIGHG